MSMTNPLLDETKMLRAAHMMVQSLAGSLASVTCKEPLRVSMMNHLRALLLQSPITEQPALAERIDAAIQTIVGENLDLGCAIIERIAAEKAILDTDEALSQAIQARRANRERGSTTYVDINVLGQRYPAALPELLKPKMVGVTANQFAVYEEFLIRSAQQTQPSPAPSTAKAPSTFSPDEAPVGVGSLNVTAEVMTPQQLQQHQILSMGTRRQAIAPTQEMFTAQDAIESFNKLMGDMVVALKQHIETHHAEYSSSNPPSSPKDIITALNPTVEELIRRVASLVTGVQYYDSTNMEIATALAQRTLLKTFESQTVPKGAKPDNVLEKVYRQNLLHTYLLVLDTLASVIPRLRRDITSWVVFADDDQLKLNREVIYGLIRFRLLDATEFDLQLVKMMDKGRNPQVIEFALFLVQKCLLQERIVNQSEFVATLDELANNATKKSTEQLPIAKVLEAVKQANTDGKREEARSKFAQLMKQPLPQISAATEERIKALFDEWMSVYYQSLTQLQPNQLNDKVYAPFIQQLQQQGYYGAKDTNENELAFHKVCLREALERCHNEQADGATEGDESSQQPKLSYKAVDALAKLVVVLVKYYPDKVGFLQNILVIVGQTLHRDYHEKPLFNQRPYFRLFAGLFHEFNSLDSAFDSYTIPLLHQFSQLFHHFQPSAYPGFTFAWLELISHRMFMPKLLKEQKGWAVMQQLLVELFTFLEPHLRNVKLTPPIRLLYKGSLRVLLVLLHDFPEFLCDYHFSLCNVIPSNCIQMRNLILSAYPRTMKLPDPFTPNLKVDLLPEIKEPPRIYSNFMAVFTDMAMMRTLDQYLKTGEPASFLPELVTKLQLTSPEQINARGTKYNVPLINGLVLYVGMKALSESSVVHPYSEITAAAAMEIFRTLATQLDTEGRYWLFSAIANQLRYPNNHTHYFSRLLLFLFAETQLEIVQEQITRVLFERLITQRPHPWGLLITFIELIKNNHYNFWDRSFIRCAPEIERLFVQVNHSISRQG
jgi:CCR4-NOT transcription complex subunit 1